MQATNGERKVANRTQKETRNEFDFHDRPPTNVLLSTSFVPTGAPHDSSTTLLVVALASPTNFSPGIAEALFATAIGLIAAIPSLMKWKFPTHCLTTNFFWVAATR